MSNFLDYITWRGDLSFRQDSFNTIDSLILTRLAYLPLDNIVTEQPITLSAAYEKYTALNRQNSDAVIMAVDNLLFEKLATSKRFKKLSLQHFVHISNEEKQVQFCAMLVHLDYRTTYILFRGTDNTLFGWKEDFNMAFESVIPSQNFAQVFVTTYIDSLRENLIFGGHSKGGNLAIYSALFADKIETKRIKAIYNFDGPGFNPDLELNDRYALLKACIKTFIPETAVVGILMNHTTNYKVIQSDAKGFAQHDTYSWQIEGCQLLYSPNRSKESKLIESAFKQVMKDYSKNDLSLIINTFYELLVSANIKDIRDFNTETPQKLLAILKKYRSLDKKSSQTVQKFIQTFIGLLITRK